MAEAFVADGGVWKKAVAALVADGGTWKTSNQAVVADGSTWKTAYSGDPAINITASASPDATWSRITYSVTTTGTFDDSDVRVMLYRRYSDTTGVYTVEHYFDAADGETLIHSAETDKLVPGVTYEIVVQTRVQSYVWRELARKAVTLTLPPGPKNVTDKTPITDTTGGKQWTSSRDIDDWNSRNNTLGTSWHHNGDKTYIWYSSGLKPQTTYKTQTRSKCNGVYGEWSGEMSWTTTAPQYTPGSYYFWPYRADVYDRYGWQGSSRSYLYHGYYSSNRRTQKTCFFYDPNNSVIKQLRTAISKGARITGAWMLLARPNTANGSYAGVTPLIAKMRCSYPNGPTLLSGNAGGTPRLERDNVARSVTTTDGGAAMRAWVREMIVGNGSITGFLLGNTGSSAYYMAFHKGNAGRMRVDIV